MAKIDIVRDQINELPNNIEAEQSVIGSILISNEIFDDVNTYLVSKNFYDPISNATFCISTATMSLIFFRDPLQISIKIILQIYLISYVYRIAPYLFRNYLK